MGLITLPENLTQYSGMTERELRIALAIFLYRELKVPTGKAGQFAGLTRIEFWEELGKRNIPLNYDAEAFEEDLEAIRRFKSKQSAAQ
jgi:predicted HTH domain antitoxin